MESSSLHFQFISVRGYSYYTINFANVIFSLCLSYLQTVASDIDERVYLRVMCVNLFLTKLSPAVRLTRSNGPEFVKLLKDSKRSRYAPAGLCLATANGGIGQRLHGVRDADGVIIVDHGSRRKESNLMLNQFVAIFREKTKYPIVEPAHMELAEPSIKDAFSLCVKQGADRIIVSPFFLSPGRHWNQDIPSLTAEAAKEHPGIPYIVTAPIGLHELLVDILNDRIKYCLSHVAGEADECSVCVGTGKCQLYD